MAMTAGTVRVGAEYRGLLVLSGPVLDEQGHERWACRCPCGRVVLCRDWTILSQRRKSFEALSGRKPIHGLSGSPLYQVWINMRSRCGNPHDPSFTHYGARGIRVCDEWLHDAGAFGAWAYAHGWRVGAGLSIHRVDGDGPYSPANCVVSGPVEQNRHTRRNHMVCAFGETKALSAWLDDPRCAVERYETLQWRITQGWPPEVAITHERRGHD
jgi:hypothetical protein